MWGSLKLLQENFATPPSTFVPTTYYSIPSNVSSFSFATKSNPFTGDTLTDPTMPVDYSKWVKEPHSHSS